MARRLGKSVLTITQVEVGSSGNGVILRTYFVSARDASQHESLHGQAVVKPPIPRLGFLSSLGKLVDLSHSRYWPPKWLKPHHEVEEILSRAMPRSKLFAVVDLNQRVLHSSSRRNYKNGEKASVLEGGVKYNVIRIDTNGNLEPMVLKSSDLGLHPRDLDLLSSGTFIPQRATIAVQRDKVLVRMENVRAIVCKDHVLLFDARHPRSMRDAGAVSPGTTGDNSSHRARDAFAKSLAQAAKEHPSEVLIPMPFHLRMMECLLEGTTNFFHQKADRLKVVVERMLQELTDDVSMGGLQRLLPLRRALTEVEHDVRDAHQAMDQVLGSDDTLQALCLVGHNCRPSSPSSVAYSHDSQRVKFQGMTAEREEDIYKLRQAAADMLLTYQREVDDAGGVLEELRKAMEAAQEVWELGLATTRNRIIRLNLYISISTCSLAIATLPAAFFGMNLPSGFEEHPSLFYWVVGAASVGPMGICVVLLLALRVWPKMVDRRRAQDLAGLLDLLHHLDNVDDIMESVAREGKAVTRKQFEEILRSHPSSQLMRQRELDLIFRMFDRNRNGVLEVEESEESRSSRLPHSRKTPSTG